MMVLCGYFFIYTMVIMSATKLGVSYVNSDVLGNEFVQYDPQQVKGYTGNLFIKPSKEWNLQSYAYLGMARVGGETPVAISTNTTTHVHTPLVSVSSSVQIVTPDSTRVNPNLRGGLFFSAWFKTPPSATNTPSDGSAHVAPFIQLLSINMSHAVLSLNLSLVSASSGNNPHSVPAWMVSLSEDPAGLAASTGPTLEHAVKTKADTYVAIVDDGGTKWHHVGIHWTPTQVKTLVDGKLYTTSFTSAFTAGTLTTPTGDTVYEVYTIPDSTLEFFKFIPGSSILD